MLHVTLPLLSVSVTPTPVGLFFEKVNVNVVVPVFSVPVPDT